MVWFSKYSITSGTMNLSFVRADKSTSKVPIRTYMGGPWALLQKPTRAESFECYDYQLILKRVYAAEIYLHFEIDVQKGDIEAEHSARLLTVAKLPGRVTVPRGTCTQHADSPCSDQWDSPESFASRPTFTCAFQPQQSKDFFCFRSLSTQSILIYPVGILPQV